MPLIPRIKTKYKNNDGNGNDNESGKHLNSNVNDTNTNNFRYVVLGIVLIAAMNALWYHQSTLQVLQIMQAADGTVRAGAGDTSTATTAAIANNNSKILMHNNNSNNYNPKRVCEQNPYAESLSMPLSEYPQQMETWLENKIRIERDLNHHPESHEHTHKRFDAFDVMGTGCEQNCIGGPCRSDTSKIACGVTKQNMVTPCVVYSIGGNNHWEFEQGILDNSPCDVHTFDCTGPKTRYSGQPNSNRSHFHHVCLGTQFVPAPVNPPKRKSAPHGEFKTLSHIQQSLQHAQIDLLKIDIEGWEWPLFDSWPTLTDMAAPTTVLPMQILVEVHYRERVGPLSLNNKEDIKHATDMISLQSRLLKMGYAVVVRDDNRLCLHCTELTLVRIQCPLPTI